MKKISIIILFSILTQHLSAQLGIRIDSLPLYTGTTINGFVPFTSAGITYKLNANRFSSSGSSSAVTSVFGRTGAILAQYNDYAAFFPATQRFLDSISALRNMVAGANNYLYSAFFANDTITFNRWGLTPYKLSLAGRYALQSHTHPGLVPIGGLTGQILKKISGTDYDYIWANDNVSSGGASGSNHVYAGYGLSNINDSTLKVDSTNIATIASKKKSIDSLAALKLNISDTAAMLNTYLHKYDTTALHNFFAQSFYRGVFDSSTRVLTLTNFLGVTTNVLIPRGNAGGASGIVTLSNSITGDSVRICGDNGSCTTFSRQDARITSADISNWNSKQPQLNGTGFVKASGTTISYDNSTYLTSVNGNNGDTTIAGNIGEGGNLIRATSIGGAYSWLRDHKFIKLRSTSYFTPPGDIIDTGYNQLILDSGFLYGKQNTIKMDYHGITFSTTGILNFNDISHFLDEVQIDKNLLLYGSFRLGTIPAELSSASNGTFYYNPTTNKIRARENGVWKDMISSGGGITDTSSLKQKADSIADGGYATNFKLKSYTPTAVGANAAFQPTLVLYSGSGASTHGTIQDNGHAVQYLGSSGNAGGLRFYAPLATTYDLQIGYKIQIFDGRDNSKTGTISIETYDLGANLFSVSKTFNAAIRVRAGKDPLNSNRAFIEIGDSTTIWNDAIIKVEYELAKQTDQARAGWYTTAQGVEVNPNYYGSKLIDTLLPANNSGGSSLSSNLQSVTNNGDTTTHNIHVNSLNLYDGANDKYANISAADAYFSFKRSLYNITGSLDFSALSINRSYLYPNKSGTIQLTSDTLYYNFMKGVQRNLNWFDVRDDGASTLLSDNSTAFDSTMARCVRGGGGIIYIPKGLWRTSRQWTVPAFTGSFAETIEIRGESQPNYNFGTVGTAPFFDNNGSIILCSGTSGAVIASAAGSGGGASYLTLIVSNLDIRTTDNPQINGIDFSYANQAIAENLFINTGIYGVQASNPTNNTAGITMPKINNAAICNIKNVTITGYHDGLIATEHTSGQDIQIAECFNGITFPTAAHSISFTRLDLLRNTRNINVTGPSYFTILDLNIEHANPATQINAGNAWQVTSFDINDSLNVGHANIFYASVLGDTYPPYDDITKNGGATIYCTHIGTNLGSGGGSSQWSGTSPIYYNGNVGIGTSVPTSWTGVSGVDGYNLQIRSPSGNGPARLIINSIDDNPEFHFIRTANTSGDRNYRFKVNANDITLDQPLDNYSATQLLMTWGNNGNVTFGNAAIYPTSSTPADPPSGSTVQWFDGTNFKAKKNVSGTVTTTTIY